MRIATWNVNSLKARLEKVEWWLDRAQPDVILLQETKLTDEDAPALVFRMRGYDLLHHGEGRWNGVAIASRVPIDPDGVVTNFGDGPVRNSGSGAAVSLAEEDFDPFDEARMLSAVVGGIRIVSLYAPNGRVVDSPFYAGKLAWYARLRRWLDETRQPDEPLLIGGDFNVAPTDEDVWDPAKVHGATHVSEPERAAFRELLSWGLVDLYRSLRPGARPLHVVGLPGRHVPQELRDAHRPPAGHGAGGRTGCLGRDRPRGPKGVPVPSDHAPLFVDLDEPGVAIDSGWESAVGRIAVRQANDQKAATKRSGRA